MNPVNVLAKIDAAIAVAEFSGTDYPTTPKRAEGLREARAVVAELVEAARRVDANGWKRQTHPGEGHVYRVARDDFDALRAALARIEPQA